MVLQLTITQLQQALNDINNAGYVDSVKNSIKLKKAIIFMSRLLHLLYILTLVGLFFSSHSYGHDSYCPTKIDRLDPVQLSDVIRAEKSVMKLVDYQEFQQQVKHRLLFSTIYDFGPNDECMLLVTVKIDRKDFNAYQTWKSFLVTRAGDIKYVQNQDGDLVDYK